MAEEAPAIKERLNIYMKAKGLKYAQLERLAGLANAYLRNSNGAIGAPKLRDILLACPDLDANWLLTGIGEMFKQSIGDTMYVTGEKAKAIQKGHMVIYEGAEAYDLDEQEFNIENIDVDKLPKGLGKLVATIRTLETENRTLATKLSEAQVRESEAVAKSQQLSDELLDLYRSMKKN